MEQLIDRFGRRINYLRISVTDRCNFRCIYCMPKDGIGWKPMSEILTYEEISLFVKASAELGINKIKLTGGEPLVRKGIDRLVDMLKNIDGIDEISLTTNGSLLKKYAKGLKAAGLDRITISLDTLKPDRFKLITRLGNIEDVLEGFDVLEEVGFENTKINTVVMRGVNDDEVLDLMEFALNRGVDIRFIEFMPTDVVKDWQRYFIGVNNIRRIIEARYTLKPADKKSNGPSVYYSVGDGFVGFITPLSKAFCSVCNRIRLTSDGVILPCLGHPDRISIKSAARSRNKNEIKSLIREAIRIKPKEHALLNESIHSSMSAVGG
ncbi:GTP 3',8-cyclase MoaA [Hippea maritima]|uniref:GTP 3',8-cyclase n=1 Tax=Hippea maritima (strain ATCC 700847 / DSM 10411 / MH2) TaxID=760142 RepID=F2LU19_HIPMA|nr:GTP 3',8-cyclase MoaA [Hippea maritima]AEA33418.1 molybdenum cofactor biosynthesis protein A [Hippea maritima DSM 10411]